VTEAVLLVAEGVLVFAAGVLVRRSPREGVPATRFSRVAIVSLLSLALLLPLLVGQDGEVARATPRPVHFDTPPSSRPAAQGPATPSLHRGLDVSVPRAIAPESEASSVGSHGFLRSNRLVPVVVPPTFLP
jgi:hypothetical protein